MIVTIITEGHLRGWRHLWAKKVTGFNEDKHCMACLRGPRIQAVSPRMPRRVRIEMEPGELLYICGVADPWNWKNNLHIAGRAEPAQFSQELLWTGTRVTVTNFHRLPIPALPDDWNGLPRSFTTCRNFQFGVRYFEID